MADPQDDVSAELFARLAADPLAAHLGITLTEVRPGYARATMTVAPSHLNAVGTAHGGATMALLDVVHAAVSNSHGPVSRQPRAASTPITSETSNRSAEG